MIIDEYKTIKEPTESEYKDKGSKFIGYAFGIKSEEEVGLYIEEVKSKHFKARHFCYAYQIGVEGDIFRHNDDGEPSGTAGKPIFGQIQSFGVTDILIVVVRYFGGTKLGVSGLISAYKESAKVALSNAVIVTKYISNVYQLEFGYSVMGSILDTVKSLDFNIIEKDFGDVARINIEIRKGDEREEIIRLKSTLLNVSPEYIDDDSEVEFCSIKLIRTND